MKTFAQVAAEDRRVMRHVMRGQVVIPEEVNKARREEGCVRSFRIEGRLEVVAKRFRERRSTQSKRGM